jgi:ERCC4-related helicase
MTATQTVPAAGQMVRVRSRQYLVDGVQEGGPGEQTLVRLSCIDDDAQGFGLEVLWQREVDARILDDAAWHAVAEKGFDRKDHFAAYLNTLRWNTVTSTDPDLFQSPFRAGIDIKAYQLEPLRKALRLPRVNLFIADDVGLGKTIEAGLIMREMLMRQKVRRIVVAAPASVTLQWRDEMEARFGLAFVVLDREYVLRMRRERGWAANPWTTHSRFIVSHSLLGDETYAGPLRDWLGDFAAGSLLVLDEAHHAAPASGARYAIDSHFTKSIRDIAGRFEHRLFLTATPHNGHSNSFSALLEILDPLRFCRGVPVKGPKLLDEVMVRRLKQDLRAVSGSNFPERRVEQIDIDGLPETAPELALARLLEEYREVRGQRLNEAKKSTQAAAALVTSHLQQRLFSSVRAFARTLGVHERTLAAKQAPTAAAPGRIEKLAEALRAPTADQAAILFDPATTTEAKDAADTADANEALAVATALADQDAEAATKHQNLRDKEHSLLKEMKEIAKTAEGLPDARVKQLIEWIRTELCPGGKWNNRRVLIFTEWTDTLRYLDEQLRGEFANTHRGDDRIDFFHGSLGDDRREELKRRFNASPAEEPLRILIATDAAREGLNLQNHCADLFHFDIPWNPARLEQRNGRIDRVLQKAPVVYCRYFFYKQRPEDRVLRAVVRKTETIEAQLGSLSPVLEGRLEKLMSEGISRAGVGDLERAVDATGAEAEARAEVEEELEAARKRNTELAEQIDAVRGLLQKSEQAIQFNKDAFRGALSCALDILGATPLTKSTDSTTTLERFAFPPLDERSGADNTWVASMDLLRSPRPKGMDIHEWRRTFPLRPVTFSDTGSLDNDVVHLHLEHRVVQRLLTRFRTQGFVHDDLSRACVVMSRDPIPRVLLLARLSLFGDGASRLHEEILTVAARVQTGVSKVKLLTVAEQDDSLRLLSEALRDNSLPQPTQATSQQLRKAAADHLAELRPHLERRGNLFAERAEKDLTKRADTEAKAMESLIQKQVQRIESQLKKVSQKQQLVIDFGDDLEKRQLESEKKHWNRRLSELPQEQEREPKRIREHYVIKARRIEPVGLVYLWPISG